MQIDIRTATNSELDIVCELISELDTENYDFSNPEDIRNYIGKGDCYVALNSEKIVGVAVLKPEDNSMELKYLVSKQAGAGRALVEKAEDITRAAGIPKLWCWSLIRYEARGFYDKMGFEEQFLLKQQWYGEDCYFFGKEL